MNLIYLVLAMAAVTYIPRMLPLAILPNIKLPQYLKGFMMFIPYAALGALIFPGVLTSTGIGHMDAAIIGCIVSIFLAWLEVNLVFVISGGIGGALLTSVFCF